MRITLNTFQTKLLREILNEKLVASNTQGSDAVTKMGSDLVRNQMQDIISQIDKPPKPRKNAKKVTQAEEHKARRNPWDEDNT